MGTNYVQHYVLDNGSQPWGGGGAPLRGGAQQSDEAEAPSLLNSKTKILKILLG